MPAVTRYETCKRRESVLRIECHLPVEEDEASVEVGGYQWANLACGLVSKMLNKLTITEPSTVRSQEPGGAEWCVEIVHLNLRKVVSWLSKNQGIYFVALTVIAATVPVRARRFPRAISFCLKPKKMGDQMRLRPN